MSFEFTGAFGLPSVASALETVENVFWWGRFEQEAFIGSIIDGSARDAGNATTDVLRPGLLMGKVTSSGKLKEWSPTATDGTQNIVGILGYSQKMQRLGANSDRWLGWIYCWGFVKAERLLIGGQADFGISANANEHIVRTQMGSRFTFNDKLEGYTFGGIRDVVAKTIDYTVTEADHVHHPWCCWCSQFHSPCNSGEGSSLPICKCCGSESDSNRRNRRYAGYCK